MAGLLIDMHFFNLIGKEHGLKGRGHGELCGECLGKIEQDIWVVNEGHVRLSTITCSYSKCWLAQTNTHVHISKRPLYCQDVVDSRISRSSLYISTDRTNLTRTIWP